MPIIGAHVSAAGGLYKAFENAKAIGARAIQIFGASPRQWVGKFPEHDVIEQFKTEYKASNISCVFLHAPYLANLASPNPFVVKQSIASLVLHLKIAEAIGAQGLIFHPGSGKGMENKKALKQVSDNMKKVLMGVPGKSELIIENTAGGGNKVGATLQDLKDMLNGAKNPRVKICFDTAHAYESGLIEEYTPKNIKSLFDAFDKTIGLDKLSAIHANDSKTPMNSHNDRHENIGKGCIGISGFKNLAKEKRLHSIPFILEVPGFSQEGPDKKNIDILSSYFL